MTEKTNIVESKVEVLDINIDDIFSGTPGGADMISAPEENTKTNTNIFKGREKADFSFSEPESDIDDLSDENPTDTEDTEDKVEEFTTKDEVNDIINTLDDEDNEEETNYWNI